MSRGLHISHRVHRRPGLAVLPVAALALSLAACGSKSTNSTASATTAAPAAHGVTIASASVPGIGTILVNGQGRTLYLLTAEQGGKLTCTDANGCTAVWPDTELPAGINSATAGAGVQASMLGTIANPAGNLYVTYAGWPLYTFSHDTAAGQANGEGIVSFGGTWEVLTPAGTPLPPPPKTGITTTTTSGGYSRY
jgi:predicted lipoprotein with Yx(FWY)xxD motif